MAGDGMPSLEILWIEEGGPLVMTPTRRGFGSRLIERGLAYELDGEVALDFEPTGVRCRVRIPLSARVTLA
jgi:two-component sensor histidine kinase